MAVLRSMSSSSFSLSSCSAVIAFVLCLVLNVAVLSNGGKTSSFVRKVEKSVDMPLDSDTFRIPPGYNAPQQVHITQGDHEGKAMIISWVTEDEPGSNTVIFWSENSKQKKKAEGKLYTYKFYNYTSGYIHHCTVKDLKYNTKYYYKVGIGHTTRQFWFVTPPDVGPDVPYTFGLIGDIGQTFDSNRALTHYEMNPTKGQTVLLDGIHGEGSQKEALLINHGYGQLGIMKLTSLLKLGKRYLSSLSPTVIMFRLKLLGVLPRFGTQ